MVVILFTKPKWDQPPIYAQELPQKYKLEPHILPQYVSNHLKFWNGVTPYTMLVAIKQNLNYNTNPHYFTWKWENHLLNVQSYHFEFIYFLYVISSHWKVHRVATLIHRKNNKGSKNIEKLGQ
jgi:hypothetical protein